MELGIILIVLGLVCVVFSGSYGRWSARFEKRNRFWRTPVTGTPLVRIRQATTALLGLTFIVVGIVALASS